MKAALLIVSEKCVRGKVQGNFERKTMTVTLQIVSERENILD